MREESIVREKGRITEGKDCLTASY